MVHWEPKILGEIVQSTNPRDKGELYYVDRFGQKLELKALKVQGDAEVIVLKEEI